MKWISYFSDPLQADEGEAKNVLGGKGAGLKEMTLAGLQVPPGFTLRTECCESYFENHQRWPEGLLDEVREYLARLETETGRKLGRGPEPLLVSVRSGAAASMPGMMDTLLNCGLNPRLSEELGNPPWFWERYFQFIRMFARTVDGLKDFAADLAQTPIGADEVHHAFARYERDTGKAFPRAPWDLLVACINAVFASWHSTRAVAYRHRHEIRGLKGTAVNVQAMWPSEVSGICFTQDPTNPQARRVVVEASYGLGEAVVSGDVAPDRFLLPREHPENVETHLGQKIRHLAAFAATQPLDPGAASLSPSQLTELFHLALRIERHFGHPVDLEWGWADGRFAVLQARAIRGLEIAEAVEASRNEEIARLKALAGGGRKVWVTHNLGETLPAPTPLTWDIVRQFMSGDGGFGRMYRDLGYQPSRRVRRDGFLELICGRIYADPDRMAELFWKDMPLAYDLDGLAADKTLLDRAPDKFDASKADGFFLLRLPSNLWSMWRSARLLRHARQGLKERFENRILPPYLAYVERARNLNLTKLDDAELRRELDERRRIVLDEFGPESLKPGLLAGLAFDSLKALLTQLLGPRQGAGLAGTLTMALEGDVTFAQDSMLFDIAHGKANLDDFLRKFGHRCIGEMELATPRWRENPAYLEQTIARLKANPGRPPAEIHHLNVNRRQEAEAELPKLLATWGGSSLREEIKTHLAQARALLPFRELGKFYLMMGYERIRQVLEEFGRRWDLGGGIYFLRLEELQCEAVARGTAEREQRKVRWQALKRLDMPDIIDSAQLDDLGVTRQIEAADELTGTPMAPGIATGVVRVVEDPQMAGNLGPDYVLVCGSTDPGWTPLFLNARALVVERGGVLSHGAIVARDFGIPALACPHATQILKDGDTVRIDGNLGRIVVLARGSADA